MKLSGSSKYILALIAILLVAGCATRTVVVPAGHADAEKHVVYYVKPKKAHCWRHGNHWHCR